jgi:hypothetical protein
MAKDRTITQNPNDGYIAVFILVVFVCAAVLVALYFYKGKFSSSSK